MNNLKECLTKYKKTGTILVVLVLFIQILIPFSMIYSNENIIRNGTQINLEIMQYDPYDFVRGRYLNVTPVATEVKNEDISKELKDKIVGQMYSDTRYDYNAQIECFVTFKKSENGMDIVDKVTLVKPETEAYMKAELRTMDFYDDNNNKIQKFSITYNIDKFFINERYAGRADEIVRNLPKFSKAHLKVRILNGQFATTDLYVGDKNIYNYIDASKKIK